MADGPSRPDIEPVSPVKPIAQELARPKHDGPAPTLESAIKHISATPPEEAKKKEPPLAESEIVKPPSITERVGQHKGSPPSEVDLENVRKYERQALIDSDPASPQASQSEPKTEVLTPEQQTAFEEARKTGQAGSIKIEEVPGRLNEVKVVDPETGDSARLRAEIGEVVNVATVDKTAFEAWKRSLTPEQLNDFLRQDLREISEIERDFLGDEFLMMRELQRTEVSAELEISIEQIERLQDFDKVVGVAWRWHELADKDPSLMWTKQNERIMDAAMSKFKEMADESQFDMTGALTGIYSEVKRLREATRIQVDPEVVDEYEELSTQIRGADRMLRFIDEAELRKPQLEAHKKRIQEQLDAGDKTEEELNELKEDLVNTDKALEDLGRIVEGADDRRAKLITTRTEIEGQIKADPRFTDLIISDEFNQKTDRLAELESRLRRIQQLEEHKEAEEALQEQINQAEQRRKEGLAGQITATTPEAVEEQFKKEKKGENEKRALESQRARLSINREVAGLTDQIESSEAAVKGIKERIASLEKDKNFTDEEKAKIKAQLEKYVSQHEYSRNQAAEALEDLQGALDVPPSAEYKDAIKKEIDLLTKELGSDDFTNLRELEGVEKRYAEQWQLFMGNDDLLLGQTIKVEEEGNKERKEAMGDLREIINDYGISAFILQKTNSAGIMRDLLRLIKADEREIVDGRGAINKNLVRTSDGEQLVHMLYMQVDEEDRPDFDIKEKAQDILRIYLGSDFDFNDVRAADIRTIDINEAQLKERAKLELEARLQEIEPFLREAKELGLLDDELKPTPRSIAEPLGIIDNMYEQLKQQLSPHPSGWNRASAEGDFVRLRDENQKSAMQYLDPIQMRSFQNELWETLKDRDPAYTDDTRRRFDGLIPFLRHRYHVQAVDYIEGYRKDSRFPDVLPNRHLIEGEWDLRKTERAFRERKGHTFWESSGSGYYYVNAKTMEEFELAVESFVGDHLKNAVKKDPNAIFQEREKFVIALGEAASRYGLSEKVRKIMFKFEMEVFAYSAELFNRDNQPALVAQILEVAGSYVDGLERYMLIPQLLGGDLAAAFYFLDRNSGSEILFRSWGPKNQYGGSDETYLLMHKKARDHVARKLLGAELKTESVDRDLLREDLIRREFAEEGYSPELVRQKLEELNKKIEEAGRNEDPEKRELKFTAEEKKLLSLGRLLKKMDSSILTPEMQEKYRQPSGEVRLTGEDAVKRNLEKVGRFQSKEDFADLYDWEAHKTRLPELEAKDRAGVPLTQAEVALLELGRIQRKIDNGQPLTRTERDEYGRRLQLKRNAVDLAIQFHSMTQHIAVRGDPSFICGNGNARDVMPRYRQVPDGHGGTKEQRILVERKEAHYVAKHLAKKYLQAADNIAKIEWKRRLRVHTQEAAEGREEIKGWRDMSQDEREAILSDVRQFFDPFWDGEAGVKIELVPAKTKDEMEAHTRKRLGDEAWKKLRPDQKEEEINHDIIHEFEHNNEDSLKKIQENWQRLTAEEQLKSILLAKGDRDKPAGKGLINYDSLLIENINKPNRPAPSRTGGAIHPDEHTFWDTYSQLLREVEAAEAWRTKGSVEVTTGKKESPQAILDRLVKGGEGLTDDQLEDYLQEIVFRKRSVSRKRALDGLDQKGFNARILGEERDENGNRREYKVKVAVRKEDGSIVTEEKSVDVMVASQLPIGQFLGIDYIAQQNEIRKQLISNQTTELARAVLDGKIRYEDVDPIVLLRIEIDPTLELHTLGGDSVANLENKERTMVFAKCHESFYGTKRIEEELRERFHDPNSADNRIAWHWTNEHIGSKRVINLAEYISTYMNSLSRRMRTNIPYILQPITSMPEMFGVSTMGVMGIPMMIYRRDLVQSGYLQEILDPPELKSYGFAVGGSVKVRDAKITSINEQGLPKEGTQEKPTNDADKWRAAAKEFVNLFEAAEYGHHFPTELKIENVMRETLGRLEAESRLNVTTIRFARTAGEEMLVERKAIFNDQGEYIFNVDSEGATSPPPVSGSRSMVNDEIYRHILWLLSDAGRIAYPSEVPFYGQINWDIVTWLVGKITL